MIEKLIVRAHSPHQTEPTYKNNGYINIPSLPVPSGSVHNVKFPSHNSAHCPQISSPLARTTSSSLADTSSLRRPDLNLPYEISGTSSLPIMFNHNQLLTPPTRNVDSPVATYYSALIYEGFPSTPPLIGRYGNEPPYHPDIPQ